MRFKKLRVLECSANGFEALNVFWLRDGIQLDELTAYWSTTTTTYQSMRVPAAELFEHVHNLLSRLDRLKVFRLQIVFFDPFDSKAEICCARNCFTPNLVFPLNRLLVSDLSWEIVWHLSAYHVSRFRDAFCIVLFLWWCVWIDLNHFLVHVLTIQKIYFFNQPAVTQTRSFSPFSVSVSLWLSAILLRDKFGRQFCSPSHNMAC